MKIKSRKIPIKKEEKYMNYGWFDVKKTKRQEFGIVLGGRREGKKLFLEEMERRRNEKKS